MTYLAKQASAATREPIFLLRVRGRAVFGLHIDFAVRVLRWLNERFSLGVRRVSSWQRLIGRMGYRELVCDF
jgi:hypothetical protein